MSKTTKVEMLELYLKPQYLTVSKSSSWRLGFLAFEQCIA